MRLFASLDEHAERTKNMKNRIQNKPNKHQSYENPKNKDSDEEEKYPHLSGVLLESSEFAKAIRLLDLNGHVVRS